MAMFLSNDALSNHKEKQMTRAVCNNGRFGAARFSLMLAAFAGFWATSSASADFIFDIPDENRLITVADLANPVTGSFDITLDVTGGMSGAADGFSLIFGQILDPNVTLTVVPPDPADELLPDTNFSVTSSALGISVSNDGNSVPVVAGKSLAKVNYEVAAGVTGTFPLDFTTSPNFNELGNFGVALTPLVLSDGTITVQIPEPASILLLLLSTGACLALRFGRRPICLRR